MYQINFDQPVHVHFIGIGGISMSGLAHILLGAGFTVSGSDAKESELTDRLKKEGARIYIGQRASNIDPAADVVVFSAAIHPDNPEYAEAVRLQIPILKRAQLLGEIMRNYDMPVGIAGTHGKTTTTSMISHMALAADMDPTISVGGMLRSIGGNIRVGHSQVFIAEACEYTNSFLSLFPKLEVILNIDADHLDFFKDINDIRRSFRKYAELLPEDGTLVINGAIENLGEITDGLKCRVITCGTENADYRAENVTYNQFGFGSFDLIENGKNAGRFELRVPGSHNVSNALAAIAAARVMGADDAAMHEGLRSFTGTDRRFEHKGEVGGAAVIDDYAHHPTEIRATLTAARSVDHKKIWCVFQPHTYTRTKALMDEFASALTLADEVVLADIYAAREKDNLGISSDDLRRKIEEKGIPAHYFSSFKEIEDFLRAHVVPGDLLITMGAGNVYQVGEDLINQAK